MRANALSISSSPLVDPKKHINKYIQGVGKYEL